MRTENRDRRRQKKKMHLSIVSLKIEMNTLIIMGIECTLENERLSNHDQANKIKFD